MSLLFLISRGSFSKESKQRASDICSVNLKTWRCHTFLRLLCKLENSGYGRWLRDKNFLLLCKQCTTPSARFPAKRACCKHKEHSNLECMEGRPGFFAFFYLELIFWFLKSCFMYCHSEELAFWFVRFNCIKTDPNTNTPPPRAFRAYNFQI